MTDDSARSSSRRRVLGAAAGTVATVAVAGCLGSLAGSPSNTQIEPEAPSEPREGTPGEFYYFLEDNGIEVDELAREDDELYLTYRSDAADVDESDEEILVIYEIYKQALIHRGSNVEFLYSEISNPFDGQAHGWGINTEWVHQYDSEEDEDEIDTVEGGNDTETAGNETDGNETGEGLDMNQITLWNNIMNSKVYKEDLEDDGVEDDKSDPEDEDTGSEANESDDN